PPSRYPFTWPAVPCRNPAHTARVGTWVALCDFLENNPHELSYTLSVLSRFDITLQTILNC
ncbi:MAG: hypothetical protein WCA40_13600, partial [Candidatus Acidiferrum sp.]